MDKANDIEEALKECNFSSTSLVILTGPTASGKTKLAVDIAKKLDGEIISADSRQIYRHLNIGTGKDISEYGDIPYHLIDICDPKEKYNITRFREDFFNAYHLILKKNKTPILCGGTGSYIHSILHMAPYSQIPRNIELQTHLSRLTKHDLIERIHDIGLPSDLKVDYNSHKRLVRALEIAHYIKTNNPILKPLSVISNYKIFCLNPSLDERRNNIYARLIKRLDEGLVDEVQQLLKNRLTYEDLDYLGLEYRYVSYYLQKKISYTHLIEKLTTEISRYAKRQMTFFRKMEKDGVPIQWI